ncbi:MAG: hypothetical protein R3C11_19210 [Planctomycetaceae bacterium]
MTKMEFELTVGDCIECGDVSLVVVDVDDEGVHFKLKSPHHHNGSSPELSNANSTFSTRFDQIPR